MYGTLVTAVIAIVLSVPVALGTALFVTEIASRKLRAIVAPFIDLLAAVPSVVYGLWGIIVLVPFLQRVETWLSNTVGKAIPIFAGPAPGVSYLTAGIVLAIMILPTVSAVCREVFLTIPREQREAAYALGATKWESIRLAVLPGARKGIVAAVILGLGRALGETIAVTIVIGNSAMLSKSLLAPGYTMASLIANELGEATSPLHTEALIAIGMLLFAVTLIANIVARAVISGGAPRIRERLTRMRRSGS
jgi:phosphate transport system permease protein